YAGRPHRAAGEIGRAPRPEGDDQGLASAGEGPGRHHEWIGAQLLELLVVQLHHVEAAEPRGGVGEWARNARAVRLLPQEQAVQVGIQEAREAGAQEQSGLQAQLVAGDEVDVQRVEVRYVGPELGPGPGRYPARHLLTAA